MNDLISNKVTDEQAQFYSSRMEREQSESSVFSEGFSLPALFEEMVSKFPEKTAISTPYSNISYQKLNDSSNELANCLRGLGVRPGQRIAILMDRSVEMFYALIGIMKLGCSYVPIDLAWPAERVKYIIRDSCAGVVLINEYTNLYELTDCMVVNLNDLNFESDSNKSWNLDESIANDAEAYLMYTSGSTGEPKGVMISHENVINYLGWSADYYSVNPTSIFDFSSSIAFDFSITCTFLPLLSGATVVLCQDSIKLNPLRYLLHLKKFNITHIKLTPSYFSKLLLVNKKIPKLIKLKLVILGGEAIIKSDVQKWLDVNSNHIVVNEYGPTETTVAVAAFKCNKDNVKFLHRIPIGKAAYNTCIYMLDSNGNLCEKGAIGEIAIGGKSVSKGYFKRHELTRESFSSNIFSNDHRCMYKTGDLARELPDGNVEFLGRVDEQIKVNGYRVELDEISACLCRCPGIKFACVLYDRNLDQSEITAYYVARDGQASLCEEDILGYLYDRLPYYMIPRRFYRVDSIPLTLNQKIDKKELLKVTKYLCGDLDFSTRLEKTIAGLYSKILCKDVLSPFDNFFNLGGDSIAATMLVVAIRNRCKKDLRITDIFKYPCVRLLSLYLRKAKNINEGGISRIPAEKRSMPHKVSHAQRRLWIVNEVEPDSSLYNIFGIWDVGGNIDSGILRYSIGQLVINNEILRTVFVGDEVIEPRQMVLKEISVDKIYEFIDLSDLNSEGLLEFVRREANLPFDLVDGPLIRAKLIKNGNKYYFSLCIHHIICDGWSFHLVLDEIESHYSSTQVFRRAPSLQYIDYSKWSNNYVKQSKVVQQLSYWGEQLLGLPRLRIGYEVLDVNKHYQGGRVVFSISSEVAAKVKLMSASKGCTLCNILLSAYYLLLSRYSQQDDFSIGILTSGRHHPHIQETIGFFVNLLPLRIKKDTNDSLNDLIFRVKAKLTEALNNQDIPFDKIVEELSPLRRAGESPFCQVLFSYQNYEHKEFKLGDRECSRVFSDNKALLFGDYGSSKFDLTLLMQENNGSFDGLFEFNSSKFNVDFIQSMANHFVNIINIFTTDLDEKVDSVNIMSQCEIDNILRINKDHSTKKIINLFVEFEACAKKYPKKIAVMYGEASITYSDLLARAEEFSSVLSRRGVKCFDTIAIFLERSLDLVISLLAILKLGAVYLPIDPFNNPDKRILDIIEVSQTKYLVVNDDSFSFHDLISVTPAYLEIINFSRISAYSHPFSLSVDGAHNDASYIICTSGSTGKPKCVLQTHKTIFNLIGSQTQFSFFVKGKTKVAFFASVGFDASIQEIFYSLLTGGELHIIPEKLKGDLSKYINYLIDNDITHIFLATGLLEYFCYEALYLELRLSSLVSIMVAGEQLKITPNIRSFFIKNNNIHLENLYGPSETHVVTEYVLNNKPESWPIFPSIGKAMANTYAFVMDNKMNLLPDGVPGELYVGGDNLAIGYYNQQDLTDERFFYANLFGNKIRLYKTGDIVTRLADSSFKYIGRNDDQVKIRGYRVELAEIEACLLSNSTVRNCAVILSEKYPNQLIMFYENQPDSGIDSVSLRRILKDNLPNYMVPAQFIPLRRFPLTENGKTNLTALRKIDILPDGAHDDVSITMTESKVLSLWMELLGERVFSLNDNFFECGGNSLLSIQLVNKIRNNFNISFPVRSLLLYPTIEGLAYIIDSACSLKVISGEAPGSIIKLTNFSSSKNIFMIHPIGGTIFCYQGLSKKLKNLSFYGVEDPSLLMEKFVFTSIENMALTYVRQIKAIQSSAPYYIGGYSMGGLIANEVASILVKEGFECELFLIDSWSLTMTNESHKTVFLKNAARYYQQLKDQLTNSDKDYFWLRLFMHHVDLLLRYEGRPLCTNAVLFKAMELGEDQESIDDPTNYWVCGDRGKLEVMNVKASHENMLDHNGATVVGDYLKNNLGFFDELDGLI